MMSFELATLLVIVIVVVRTAVDGVVVGEAGDGPEDVELGLELELPQAATAKNAAAVQAAAARRRMLMPTLDLKRARRVTSLSKDSRACWGRLSSRR